MSSELTLKSLRRSKMSSEDSSKATTREPSAPKRRVSVENVVKLKVVKASGAVVRTKAARKQLDGFTCKECQDYYGGKNLSAEELKKRLKNCSRHRSKFSPPKSPEHFWDTDFPSTKECIRRGYINIAKDNKNPFHSDEETDCSQAFGSSGDCLKID